MCVPCTSSYTQKPRAASNQVRPYEPIPRAASNQVRPYMQNSRTTSNQARPIGRNQGFPGMEDSALKAAASAPAWVSSLPYGFQTYPNKTPRGKSKAGGTPGLFLWRLPQDRLDGRRLVPAASPGQAGPLCSLVNLGPSGRGGPSRPHPDPDISC